MKTYLTYGFAMAVAGALLTLVLFFLGFHSDAAKLASAQWIGGCGLLAIGITCTVLGIKARRAEVPATDEFGYGQAFFAGFMITLFAALCGIVTTFLYMKVVNPGFTDIIVQAQLDKMEAKGISGDQLDRAEKAIRFFTSPIIQCISNFIGGMVFGSIISLISAAFLKRATVESFDEPPAVKS